jgi:hypothetical protein
MLEEMRYAVVPPPTQAEPAFTYTKSDEGIVIDFLQTLHSVAEDVWFAAFPAGGGSAVARTMRNSGTLSCLSYSLLVTFTGRGMVPAGLMPHSVRWYNRLPSGLGRKGEALAQVTSM